MKKVFVMAAAIWMLFAAMFLPVYAAETGLTVIGTVMKIDTDVDVYQRASESSEVTAKLKAGTVVLVTEGTEDGWSMISVNEMAGYIRTEHLETLGSDEINQEFEQIGNNYHMLFNEVEQLKKQKTQARIWGTVIAVLVIGIVAAGMIPVIKKNRENEKKKTETVQ